MAEKANLQQQKSYRRIRRVFNENDLKIYNSRNLIDVLDNHSSTSTSSIYNSRNLIDVLDCCPSRSKFTSTTVEILQTYQTKIKVVEDRISTTVEILQTYQTDHFIRSVVFIYNSRNLIDVLDKNLTLWPAKSTTVEILQTYQTNGGNVAGVYLQQQKSYRRIRHEAQALSLSHLQQQKSYRRIRPFPQRKVQLIYNSRNLIDVLDFRLFYVSSTSTTVEILQTYQTLDE